MKTTKKFIAIVNSLPQLIAHRHDDFRDMTQVSVTIGDFDEEGNHPGNWRHSFDEPKQSCGGCSGRIHASKWDNGDVNLYFGQSGPDISYTSDERVYYHGAKALKLIRKRLHAMYLKDGAETDAAASLGRWLKATGLKGKCVWKRPEGYGTTGWHNHGKWEVLTIEEFVEVVRSKYPVELKQKEAA